MLKNTLHFKQPRKAKVVAIYPFMRVKWETWHVIATTATKSSDSTTNKKIIKFNPKQLTQRQTNPEWYETVIHHSLQSTATRKTIDKTLNKWFSSSLIQYTNFISVDTKFKSDSPTLTNTYTTVFKDRMYVLKNKVIGEIKWVSWLI
jgi:hypothetical protein